MEIAIRSAQEQDIQAIVELVNRFAAQNIMLPRKAESVRQTLRDWIVAVESTPQDNVLDLKTRNKQGQMEQIVGCGALVPLTNTLVEVRSLAIHESQQGRGVGGELVLRLVEEGREQGYEQLIMVCVCAHMCAAHLQEATGGRGVNVVLEMVAEKNLNQDLLMLAQFGRIVVIGCRGPINFQPVLTIGKEATIVGVSLSKTTTPVCGAAAHAPHSCVPLSQNGTRSARICRRAHAPAGFARSSTNHTR